MDFISVASYIGSYNYGPEETHDRVEASKGFVIDFLSAEQWTNGPTLRHCTAILENNQSKRLGCMEDCSA